MYPKIGLALSGGAARGLAHIGVLKVLKENNIPIRYIAATSVGSIIGAAYAGNVPIEKMEEFAMKVRWGDLGRFSFGLMGLSDSSKMEKYLAHFLPTNSFEELRIPLRVTATDLLSGEPVIFSYGDLCKAIRGSCALPGIYAPVKIDGRLIADGGLTNTIPCKVARDMGADIVVAVDVRGNLAARPPRNVFQVVMQTFAIFGYSLRQYQALDADFIISPNVSDIAWDELGRAKEAIEAGEKAAREALPALLKLIRPSFLSLVSSLFKSPSQP